MLELVARSIAECSEQDRARLARFFAAQTEEKLSSRPGVSRILSWLGVAAAGREPHPVALTEIPVEDRAYIRDLAITLERLVRDEAALNSAETPEDMEEAVDPDTSPVAAVWALLAEVMERSLGH